MRYDFILKNCRLIDGAGGPWRRADVGVKDGRIAFTGKAPENAEAEEVIDCEGLYLAPVFTVAVHMERKARHRLGENTDAGIHSSHLQRGALIHRLAAGGAAKEKGKAAATQGILRPAQFLRLIP